MSKTLKEIDEMEASEVLLWKYYLMSEPRFEKRSDWHAAQICHAIYTFMLGFSSSKTQIKLEDNLLKFESPFSKSDKPIDPDEQTIKNIMKVTQIFNSGAKKTIPNLMSKIKEIDKNNKDKINQTS